MNIQVDPTSSNLASAMLNSKIRPRAVVGYGVKIFHPSPPNYVTRSPGSAFLSRRAAILKIVEEKALATRLPLSDRKVLNGAFSIVCERLRFTTLNNVVLAGDFPAIITFDKMELDEF